MPLKPTVDDSDEEFEYDAPAAAAPTTATATTSSSSSSLPRTNPLKSSHLGLPRKVLDQPYDEAVDISASSAESVSMSADGSPMHGRVLKEAGAGGKVLSMDSEEEEEEEEEDEDDAEHPPSKPTVTVQPPAAVPHASPKASPKASVSAPVTGKKKPQSESETEEDDEDDESDEDKTTASSARASSQAKLYNPADFAHLSVPPELSSLFLHITSFKPFDIELDTKFLPFIPDYIPAIGDIDPFIKVDPPDTLTGDAAGVGALLGLTVVDEPSSSQSEPSTLELQLRVMHKGLTSTTQAVPRVERAESNTRKVQKWIDSVGELHAAKPQARVVYAAGPMPDLEVLMQAWPAEVEAVMRQVGCDVVGLDVGVKEMARLACAMMDIPVYGDDSLHESLHLLFSLYHTFNNNAHFQQA